MSYRILKFSVMCILIVHFSHASYAGKTYTVNGSAIAPEMAMLLEFYGFGPGAYYIDRHGNYGASGAPPVGNLQGGMVRNWTGVEPKSTVGNAYAQAYVNGVIGARIFWVYSPSIFSDVRGGGSGYFHICPNNVYYASSEMSVSASGGGNHGGVASAGTRAGRWAIEKSVNGPVLAGYGSKGTNRVALITLLQGSWTVGRTKYSIEAGKADCR